jgi:hypothetical protein
MSVIAFASCDKDCVQTTGIEGEWVWTKSIGGIAGWTLTPNSEGINKKLLIDAYTYQEFENDTLIFEDQYDLVIRNSNTYIDFENGLSYIIDLETYRLELTEYLWTDGFTHFYLRK